LRTAAEHKLRNAFNLGLISNALPPMSADIQPPDTDRLQKLAGKYLTFNLGTESYGLPVLRIREIIRETRVTPMPQLPEHIKGVINLRGKIIPVLDLRTKFNLGQAEVTEHKCIVVVQAFGVRSAEIHVGLLVDDVQEVIQITTNELEETPEFGCSISRACVLALAKLKSKVVILLSIDQALALDSTRADLVAAADAALA
jgi:purine-binding chemotaxis protein CheW